MKPNDETIVVFCAVLFHLVFDDAKVTVVGIRRNCFIYIVAEKKGERAQAKKAQRHLRERVADFVGTMHSG